MKIIGFTDVITNSSSEVFTIYDESVVNAIRELVNSILKINGDYTFDDLFTIEFKIDDERVEDYWHDEYQGTPSHDELLDFAKHFDENHIGESVPLIEGITVKARDSANDATAKLISEIGNYFEGVEVYC